MDWAVGNVWRKRMLRGWERLQACGPAFAAVSARTEAGELWAVAGWKRVDIVRLDVTLHKLIRTP